MHRLLFLLFFLLGTFKIFEAYAQEGEIDVPVDSSFQQTEQMLAVIEESIRLFHLEQKKEINLDSLFASYGYEENDVPDFPDSVYCARITEMNLKSPFQLECNASVVSVLKFFAKKRRDFTAMVIGRSALYFDLFEEQLAAHDLPLELKYLAVIESGLRPYARSRAGALGLWQFMYRTGKMYGLNQNSYIDERMDPVKSTEAACRYLGYLYGLYNDWNLALAAYNAGPGNVNKAIRRSGGKMNYWEVRRYLPRETQGYVPNFIAMSYMMSYYVEHNITPVIPMVYDFELDTVCLKSAVHMQSIDSLIGWGVDDIKLVNPIYKMSYIPKTEPKQCINIPTTFVKEWIALEDSLYRLDSVLFDLKSIAKSGKSYTGPANEPVVHYVRSGENLSVIASRYGTSVSKLMEWNNLRSSRLRIGQKLYIYGGRNAPVAKTASKPKSTVAASAPPIDGGHTIRRGESLWKIAQKYGTTVDALLKMNPGVNPKDLKVGQKIRVK